MRPGPLAEVLTADRNRRRPRRWRDLDLRGGAPPDDNTRSRACEIAWSAVWSIVDSAGDRGLGPVRELEQLQCRATGVHRCRRARGRHRRAARDRVTWVLPPMTYNLTVTGAGSIPAAATAAVCVVAIASCGSSGHNPSASSHASTQLAFPECMRSHGVTGFPDPATTPPANLHDYSIAEGIGGLFLLVPSTINANSPRSSRPPRLATFTDRTVPSVGRAAQHRTRGLGAAG